MWKCGTALCAALLCAGPLSAQVVRLEIDSREPMSPGQQAGAASRPLRRCPSPDSDAGCCIRRLSALSQVRSNRVLSLPRSTSTARPNRSMPGMKGQFQALVRVMFVQSYRLLLDVELLDSTKDSV
jgi:hypothetical protein